MHLVALDPPNDEHHRQRAALSQYVRQIANSCADPELIRQLNEIARYYEDRINGCGRHPSPADRPAHQPAAMRRPTAVLI